MPDSEEEDVFIHSPDELDDDPRNGLVCFLNDVRQCGADCMAYTTSSAESPTFGPQQKHCSLLVGIDRLGRHTGIAARILSDMTAKQRTAMADQARAQQKPPAGPLVKPTGN